MLCGHVMAPVERSVVWLLNACLRSLRGLAPVGDKIAFLVACWID